MYSYLGTEDGVLYFRAKSIFKFY